jgi:hypothetical protein
LAGNVSHLGVHSVGLRGSLPVFLCQSLCLVLFFLQVQWRALSNLLRRSSRSSLYRRASWSRHRSRWTGRQVVISDRLHQQCPTPANDLNHPAGHDLKLLEDASSRGVWGTWCRIRPHTGCEEGTSQACRCLNPSDGDSATHMGSVSWFLLMSTIRARQEVLLLRRYHICRPEPWHLL